MTSGNFHSVPIESIQSNREERQRSDLPDIDVLANSISRLGLIHPVVITRDFNLVAGERRLEAVRSLGWTHINIQYADDTDHGTLHAIELEENVKRKDLTWQDECRAIAEYHSFRSAEVADWTMDDTAVSLGLKQNTVSEKLAVASKLTEGNAMVSAAPKYSIAKGIVQRAEARKDIAAMADLKSLISPGSATVPERTILNTNFTEWAPTYTGTKFNFIHCDFPYGIGADKFNQGSAGTHGGYDDSEETYYNLMETLAHNLDRIATPSAHFMFWFSMGLYTDTLDFFDEFTDIKFDRFPLIWVKSDNIGILPDPTRGPRRIYETCLFGSRGDRKVVRAKSNSYYGPSVRDVHMSVKPQPMLEHFFEMFVDDSTSFLDPTCGSGSSVRAALTLNAPFVRGLELNPEFAETAEQQFLIHKERRAVL